MPTDSAALLTDLAAETAALRDLIDPLPDAAWRCATPAPGWTVGDQIGHLAYFDDVAVMAATDPRAFASLQASHAAAAENPDTIAARYRALGPSDLLEWFGRARARLLEAFAGLDPSVRVPWFGPPMGVSSMITARLMETWAHGQDIADTLSARREPTARLQHVAHLGVITRFYSYAAHALRAPDEPVRVELTGPSGELWTWGPEDAPDRITGPALDFCLLVTQRRHRADTSVIAHGPAAEQWLSIAQAFAGPPGPGRIPGQFSAIPAL
jgi:uncharacterized protein (TIGR03084 family)